MNVIQVQHLTPAQRVQKFTQRPLRRHTRPARFLAEKTWKIHRTLWRTRSHRSMLQSNHGPLILTILNHNQSSPSPSLSTTWKLVINRNSQAPFQTYWILSSRRWAPGIQLNKSSGWFWLIPKFESHEFQKNKNKSSSSHLLQYSEPITHKYLTS